MATFQKEIERHLNAWNRGSPEALGDVMQLAFDDLHNIARRCLRREEAFALQPSTLISEVYLRLHGIRRVDWRSARHFFGFATETMRRILIDQARRRRRLKRGGGAAPLSLEGRNLPQETPADLRALDESLMNLVRTAPRQARVVHLRFFVGLSVEETAAALEVSTATVKRDWNHARLWLMRQIRGPGISG